MAITASDILFKFSVKTGSAGDTLSGSAAASLGKYISTTQITDNSLNNLFDNISGDENAASTVDYRCIFVHNNHATLTWTSVVCWISAEVSSGASVAISLDSVGVTVKGSSSAQATSIATETDVPSGTSFSSPTTKLTGLAIGDIPAGSVAAVWVRRSAANTAAVNSDGCTISISGDTAA